MPQMVKFPEGRVYVKCSCGMYRECSPNTITNAEGVKEQPMTQSARGSASKDPEFMTHRSVMQGSHRDGRPWSKHMSLGKK